jgi:hypothetical protein
MDASFVDDFFEPLKCYKRERVTCRQLRESLWLSLHRRKNAGRFGQVAQSQKVVQSCKGKGLALLQIARIAVANDGARTPA